MDPTGPTPRLQFGSRARARCPECDTPLTPENNFRFLIHLRGVENNIMKEGGWCSEQCALKWWGRPDEPVFPSTSLHDEPAGFVVDLWRKPPLQTPTLLRELRFATVAELHKWWSEPEPEPVKPAKKGAR